MPSVFAWLDYSERERRKVLDVLKAIGEEDSRDELGIGSIRDAFADMLFPGTSTIQTRARYFLFVPWIYTKLEKASIPAAAIHDRARRDELGLIAPLSGSADSTGTIGQRAGRALQRLPSNVYWLGLERWGIRIFHGSQDQYHRSFGLIASMIRGVRQNDDGEPLDGEVVHTWHGGLPIAPADFPKGVSFRLSRHEAEYLRERIMSHAAGSLLSFLVDRGQVSKAAFPWEHPQAPEFPSIVQEQLAHARQFSEIINGAALLYNLMLAEEGDRQGLVRHNGGVQKYRKGLRDWQESLASYASAWPRDRFWDTVLSQGAKIGVATRSFVETWFSLAFSTSDIAENATARELIRHRERLLKQSKARLNNPRKLELWSGAAGTGRLDYRWPVAQQLVTDILTGLGREE